MTDERIGGSMFGKAELLREIQKAEKNPQSLRDYEKLAILYTIYEHLYVEKCVRTERFEEEVIGRHGDSDFLSLVADRNSEGVWKALDELMDELQVRFPDMYLETLTKIQSC